MGREDVYAVVEEAVAPYSVPGEARHAVSNLEGRPAIDTRLFHPRRLAWWVVRHLVLEEQVRAAISVPDRLVLLVVLDEQAMYGHGARSRCLWDNVEPTPGF